MNVTPDPIYSAVTETMKAALAKHIPCPTRDTAERLIMAAMKHIADNHGHHAAESLHAELGYALKQYRGSKLSGQTP
jgi:hypothetical protein